MKKNFAEYRQACLGEMMEKIISNAFLNFDDTVKFVEHLGGYDKNGAYHFVKNELITDNQIYLHDLGGYYEKVCILRDTYATPPYDDNGEPIAYITLYELRKALDESYKAGEPNNITQYWGFAIKRLAYYLADEFGFNIPNDVLAKLQSPSVGALSEADAKELLKVEQKEKQNIIERYDKLKSYCDGIDAKNDEIQAECERLRIENENLKRQAPPSTPEQEALNDVGRTFWANHPRDKIPPKKQTIVNYITAKYGFSNKMAEAIDSLARPLEYRQGGNKAR